MSLLKLQQLELKILLELKRICDKHNIQYFLMGGTLLGAVRHQGFIPWDDDIDIGMIRSEYNRFLEICSEELSEEYFLQTAETECAYASSFAKIRLNGTEYPEPQNYKVINHNGIYIDVFPFDKTPNNVFLRKMHNLTLKGLNTISLVKCDYTLPDWSIILKMLTVVSKLFSREKVIEMRSELFNKFNNKNTKYYINSTLNIYPAHVFDKFIELEFEGINFPAPAGYHTYLECAYGDYMQLPPEDERGRHTPFMPNFGKYA
ncbi:MAG: LicD family protein [Euryarchaeota archaeon]|nr:LicD family protein [Euryarchaeota archaeon]